MTDDCREVLETIANFKYDCGCVPCRGQCKSADALKDIIDEWVDNANKALTRTPPAGDAPKAVCNRDGDHWKVTDRISTGRGNTPQAAYAAFNEDKAFNVHKYAALSAPKIDFEGLKCEIWQAIAKKYSNSHGAIRANTVIETIDHIAAKYPQLRGE